jgi:hypothetical protein
VLRKYLDPEVFRVSHNEKLYHSFNYGIILSVSQPNIKLTLGVKTHIKFWQSNKDDGNGCEDERWI